MKSKPHLQDTYWILGACLLCLSVLWLSVIVGSRRRQTDLQNQLAMAIDKGQSAKARELLDNGVDPKKMPNPAGLISAVVYCDPATVQAMIAKGVEVNGKSDAGFTALHYAVIHRRCDMVEVLLKNDANVWIKKPNGDTVLAAMSKPAHKFAKHDNDQKIILLLQQAERKSKR